MEREHIWGSSPLLSWGRRLGVAQWYPGVVLRVGGKGGRKGQVMKELWAGYFRDSSGPWAPGLQKRVMPCAVSKGIKPSGPGTHVKTKKQHNVEGLRQRMGGGGVISGPVVGSTTG